MIKKAVNLVRIPCIYYLDNGSTIEHCKKCQFFNGFIKDGKPEKEPESEDQVEAIDCLRGDIPSIRCHVTSFEMGEYKYSSRMYDKETDGPIEGDDPYDFCQKCCFTKKLMNGKEICTLRCGTEGSNFMCYEGEIWTKEKIEYEDD